MRDWSKSWKSSKKIKKQRKYVYKAPLHIRGRMLNSNLSKELRKKYKLRSVRVRKGDTVKIMRGKFRSKTGKVERVDMKKLMVYIEGIETIKKDGNKRLLPIHPSTLQIKELNTEDRERLLIIERRINMEKK